MTQRRHYKNGTPVATLSASVGAADPTGTLASAVGQPATFPFVATLDADIPGSLEVVLVTNIVGNVVSWTRGYDNTTAVSHLANAKFTHEATAIDFDEANAHTTASAGVHGVVGALVGTTDAQTLTNKNLTAPVLAGPSVTGTLSGVNATLSGTLAVTGTATLTGAVTAASTVAATGAVTGASFAANGDGKISGVHHFKVYADETARDAGNPTPGSGDMVYLSAPVKDQAGLFVYKGTQWVPSGGVARKTAITTDASGFATVTHNLSFTPTVVVASGAGPVAGPQSDGWNVDTLTSTTFRVRAYQGGAALASSSVTVAWVAYP